ncbi:MAG: hypothetical protein P1Q69_16340 [Candidatus Thorarchaeota archaeon]|nr:hypothetical protein [Candidatus Thorarchaeota archaeon]
MAKIENPLLLTMYTYVVDKVLEETNNIEEANEALREVGRNIGSHLYLNTEIAEKTKETINTREDVAKLVDVVYKILFDRRPQDVDMDSARGSIRVGDKECVWCQEISLEGMRGFGYCEIFSGIMESILQFKGVQAKIFQEMSRATGSDMCVWNIRLT